MIKYPQIFVWIALTIVGWTLPFPALAQQGSRSANAEAPLVVDGIVRQVFRNAGQGQNDYLLQIDVQRSEARKTATGVAPLRFPAPGESVFVHFVPRPDQLGRPLLQENRKDLPAEGSNVRAYLNARQQGGWEAASADWYELDSDRAAAGNSSDRVPAPVENSKAANVLGMTAELLKVENQFVLRVTSVERNGAAQSAGLEVGDVIAAADGAAITSANQLAPLAAKGKKFPLVVIDVNSGRGARIDIDPQVQPASASASDKPPAQPAHASLGLSAEPVTIGMRSALKVTRVDPAGPSAKVGLEPGDILVAANGTPTTGVEQLLSALRKSGPTLKLTVRNSRTGKDVDVDVNLGSAANAAPAEVQTKIMPSNSKLGAVTELAFNDNDFAVKVTEVEPGSAAARAGLRPGILIVAADGRPVLHPNDLNDAIRKANGSIKLTVVEPTSGTKSSLDVSLR